VHVERQKAQEAFDAARVQVDRAQRELGLLKARLAEEEAVSKLLEARLDTLAAEMLEEAPDVISRTTSQAKGELQLSATRIRGLKIKIQAAEAALRGCSAALAPTAAALDRAVYVERVEAEAAEIDREIKAAEQAFARLDQVRGEFDKSLAKLRDRSCIDPSNRNRSQQAWFRLQAATKEIKV